MNQITNIQAEVLKFILMEIVKKSRPPSHREIASYFGWSSNAASECHLLALEKKGFIRTLTRISRGIEVKPRAWELAHERGWGHNTPRTAKKAVL